MAASTSSEFLPIPTNTLHITTEIGKPGIKGMNVISSFKKNFLLVPLIIFYKTKEWASTLWVMNSCHHNLYYYLML